ncbi:hypothetical protein [Amycolatopsis sp. cmx-4-68]|uniref:hypothetical protein n=1 Tax=Amycolatopsis sp. cmx-4-68 TaxID=2790938 RepID=UPI00397AF4A0
MSALRVLILTTAELAARLPEVSKAAVYRQIDLLARAGVLEGAEEQRVHGAVDHYRLRQVRAVIHLEAARK